MFFFFFNSSFFPLVVPRRTNLGGDCHGRMTRLKGGSWGSERKARFFRLLTNTKLSQHGLNPYSNVMIKCGVFPPSVMEWGGWMCDGVMTAVGTDV